MSEIKSSEGKPPSKPKKSEASRVERAPPFLRVDVVDFDQFFDIFSTKEQVAGASSRSFAAVRSYSVVTDLICRSGRQIGHGTEWR
jgi:hypothetical protein